ncbi:MAG TPA: hypothetical protein VJ885_19940 [Thermoanaerobaculia bacterium]|nr:hypothetical protein [Thermoanaerobaculia bacterium]
MRMKALLGMWLTFGLLAFQNVAAQSEGERSASLTPVPSPAALVPIGAIIDWWRPAGTNFQVPDGFQICDGSLINDAASPYNGHNTPDLRQRFIFGATSYEWIGSVGGFASVSASVAFSPSGDHSHNLPSSTGGVYSGGNSLCGTSYTTCDDGGGWSSSYHLRVDGGSSTQEGQHRHSLGGSVSGGEHTHIATVPSITTVPPFTYALKIMRIK